MWRWVIRDYFTAFRWQKAKEEYFSLWWILLYFGVVLPLMWGGIDKAGGTEGIRGVVIYYSIWIPIMYCFISGTIHKLKLPKIMYICPVKKSVRKEYITRFCVFRMIVPSLLGVIGVISLIGNGFCDLTIAGIIILNVGITAILLCGFSSSLVTNKSEKMAQPGNYQSVGVVEVVSLLLAMLSNFGIYILLCENVLTLWWVKWIFIGCAIFLQLPLIINYLSKWKETVERVVSYEGGNL